MVFGMTEIFHKAFYPLPGGPVGWGGKGRIDTKGDGEGDGEGGGEGGGEGEAEGDGDGEGKGGGGGLVINGFGSFPGQWGALLMSQEF